MATQKSVEKYNPQEVESKWQQQWLKDNMYQAADFDSRPKRYILVEFPYPSGDGLHVGHSLSYIAQDIVARQARMQGHNVLYPMGWDAFGLPTENFAIKNKIKPQDATARNVATFKRQIQSIGISFDWSREVNTTDPHYYKWTQWIFLQLFKHGLAEKKEMPINWCPKDKIGLAFEEVIDGKCERCGTPVERRNIKQWVLKITKYADRLIDDLDTVDFLPEIKQQQINWIGRSEGAEIEFKIKNQESRIKVFTTRPDTLFGATYLVLAPEHEMIKNSESGIQNLNEVKKYIKEATGKTDRERQESREKTGVELNGVKAINPANGEEIPIWVADYVFASYGTGAIMAVPAHDERDFEFAQKYRLPIKYVVAPKPSTQEKTILVVHGFSGHDKKNWFPWLKKEFEALGYRVIIPNLPTTGNPKREEWMTALKAIQSELKGEITIIGHSLGAFAACKFIEKSGLSVDKLFLVAPVGNSEQLFGKVLKAGFTPEEERALREFVKVDVDQKIVKKFASRIFIYLSTDDPYIPLEIEKYYKELGAQTRIFQGRQHFSDTTGITSLTEIIPDVLAVYTENGILINSGELSGVDSEEAKRKITEKVGGKKTVQYKLRDWIFSRQHYWGEPIPIVHCEKCGFVPVDEKDLPIILPDVDHYEPTDTGESPLAKMTGWVNVKCPKCGGPAKRETDTMPNWAGSSWYFLRYTDPKNEKALADKKKLEYWLPVDFYNGGAEHTTLHLLYSRFWHKFLFDIGVVPTAEPYQRRVQHGMILAPDGQKMSKSRGNVINPDDIVSKYGADVLRLYILFMGEYDKVKQWSDESVAGVARFLKKVWQYAETVEFIEQEHNDQRGIVHQTIQRINTDLDRRSFNTTVSHFMVLFNTLQEHSTIEKNLFEEVIRLLAPFAPYITEEIWRGRLEHTESVHGSQWPAVNENYIRKTNVTVGIQINGKIRDTIEIPVDLNDEEQLKEIVFARDKVRAHVMDPSKVKKFIYVKNKIVSIVL